MSEPKSEPDGLISSVTYVMVAKMYRSHACGCEKQEPHPEF